MNYYQEQKLSMFRSMEHFLVGTSPEIFDAIPNFTVLFKEFQDKVAKLNVILGKQTLQRNGNTKEKNTVRKNLCFMGADVAGKIRAYAINTNNYQLRSEVNYSKSFLLNCADTKCIIDCTIIWEKGTEYLNDLAAYGITEVVVTNFKGLIDLYNLTIPKPKEGVVAKKAATDALRIGLKEATDLLDKMQMLTKVVEVSKHAFFVDFKNTKRFNSPSYNTLMVIGTVEDEAGNAVAYTTMSCKELGFVRKVSEQGGFRLKNFPDGIYPFVFIRAGYVTTVFEMVFYRGVRADVKVVMQRIA